jgi:heptosyltransferase-2
MKIGIFLPNWIGDVVMATPTLRALRRHYGPSAQIVGIMKPYVTEVLTGTSFLDEIWLFDQDSNVTAMRTWPVIWRMYRYRFNLVVFLVNTRRHAIMAWLARAAQRVGYVRYKRGPFLTQKLFPLKNNGGYLPCPLVDYYLQIAYALGCPMESPRMELATTNQDEKAADDVWRNLGLHSKVVTVNSSGAFGASKLWPDEYCGELARRIANDLEHDVLILCGPEERERAKRIAGMSRHPRVFSLAEQKITIGLIKACIRRSRLLVSTDSGPRHFAPAFDVPVIALFGPTDIRWSDTHSPKEVQLQIPVDCGPCHQRICPLEHHKCMVDLDVDTVFEAVYSTLSMA